MKREIVVSIRVRLREDMSEESELSIRRFLAATLGCATDDTMETYPGIKSIQMEGIWA